MSKGLLSVSGKMEELPPLASGVPGKLNEFLSCASFREIQNHARGLGCEVRFLSKERLVEQVVKHEAEDKRNTSSDGPGAGHLAEASQEVVEALQRQSLDRICRFLRLCRLIWPRVRYMEDECPICQEQLSGLACGTEVLLPCQHLLCKDCTSALARHGYQGCPLCRQPVVARVEVDDRGYYSSAAALVAAVQRQREGALLDTLVAAGEESPPEQRQVHGGHFGRLHHDMSGRLVMVDRDILDEIRNAVMEARRRRASSAIAAGTVVDGPPRATANDHPRARAWRLHKLTCPEPGTTFCQSSKCEGCQERRVRPRWTQEAR